MTPRRPIALVAAVLLAGLAQTPAVAQSLAPMVVSDTGPAMRAAFEANLAALGVSVGVGQSFGLQDYITAQRIMNDRSNPPLKAQRIRNLLNTGNQFRPGPRR